MNRPTNFIAFSRPSIGREERRAVNRVLKGDWLTSAEENILFEEEFASTLKVDHALTVNSATSGLHLAVEALGLSPGDQVIVPAYTFTATAEILNYCGLIPLFCDIDDDYNISPEEVERLLKSQDSKKVKAIILVHFGGLSCKMEKLLSLAKEFNLFVIEDCAHSFPAKTALGDLGTLGDIGVFSFYANKTLTTGEGGMVVSNNADFIKRMKLMRLHGIDKDIWNRFGNKAKSNSWQYDVIEAGFKYNMTNFQAAMGRVQLKRAFSLKEKRRRAANYYINNLKNSDKWVVPNLNDNHSWHLFIIQLKSEKERNNLMEYLYERKIGTSVHYIPLPALSFYKKKYNVKLHDYPVSDKKFKTSLSLPLFPDIKKSQLKRIVITIRLWESENG